MKSIQENELKYLEDLMMGGTLIDQHGFEFVDGLGKKYLIKPLGDDLYIVYKREGIMYQMLKAYESLDELI